MAAGFRLVPLDAKRHDRTSFVCGVDALDRYLRTQAAQDMRRKANAVFVLVALDDPGQIVGYFTLAATALAPGDVPQAARQHVPRYPLVSATLIGRLAVAKERQGQGIGAIYSRWPWVKPTPMPMSSAPAWSWSARSTKAWCSRPGTTEAARQSAQGGRVFQRSQYVVSAVS